MKHHVKDSHDEYKGGGGHGQSKTRPWLVCDDDRGPENPEPRSRRCCAAVLK